MCGRYYIEEEEDSPEIREIFSKLRDYLGDDLPKGEIFPTQQIPVFMTGRAAMMHWGFEGGQGRAIINARSETLTEKPLFRDHIASDRIIIPARGFYEWDKQGRTSQKYAVSHTLQPMMMAGLCRKVQGAYQAVIITRTAIGGMEAIHDRMPLLLSVEQARQWIARRTEWDAVCALLQAQAPEIVLREVTASPAPAPQRR